MSAAGGDRRPGAVATLWRLSDAWDRRWSEEHLLVFDRRLQAFLLGALLLAAFFVGLGIHGSSMHFWDRAFPPADPGDFHRGVLLGEPRAIRSDEFINYTPSILSQVARGMPVRNESLGGLEAPLLANVPTRHFTTFFRPQLWGFFFLDADSGFAWFWAFKTFGLYVSSVLLLLILTGNRFWLALLGAGWIYFSGFIQWFFSVPFLPELLASAHLAVVAGLYVLFSGRRGAILFASIMLVIFSVSAALMLYVPFLAPVLYLELAICVGFLCRRGLPNPLHHLGRFRLAALGGAVLGIGAILFLYLVDVKESLEALAATVYPGARSFRNGFLKPERYFNGIFGAFMSQEDFPELWPNVCESSNFILLFPVVAIGIAVTVALREAVDPLIVSLLGYIALMSAWLVWGLPLGIAKLTLLDKIHWRGVLGVGVASILVVIVFLSERGRKKRIPLGVSLVVAVAIVAAALEYGFTLGEDSEFFTPGRIFAAAASTGLLAFFLLRRQVLPFAVVLAVSLSPNLLVNPVAKGLRPIVEKPIVEAMGEMALARPEATWLVYEGASFTNLLKASGATVLGGYHLIPSGRMLSVLDPAGAFTEIHQRSANISFRAPLHGDGGDDGVDFELTNLFNYTVWMRPCAPELAALGVDFVVLPKRHSAEWEACSRPWGGSFGRLQIWELSGSAPARRLSP